MVALHTVIIFVAFYWVVICQCGMYVKFKSVMVKAKKGSSDGIS